MNRWKRLINSEINITISRPSHYSVVRFFSIVIMLMWFFFLIYFILR